MIGGPEHATKRAADRFGASRETYGLASFLRKGEVNSVVLANLPRVSLPPDPAPISGICSGVF
jgi:hypothetical protein